MHGIDISEHNGNINLAPYRGQFVIIRVGYGNFTLDKKFTRNVAECKRLGIPFGVYHYSYALSRARATQEAQAVLRAIAPYKKDIKCGVWFDMEDADGYKRKHGLAITHGNIAPMCYDFCKAIESAGYYAGIYTASSWLQYMSGTCDRFDKWVANWGRNNGTQTTNTSKLGTIQQYTSRPLDKNIMYADISRYTGGKPTANTEPDKLAVDGQLGTYSVMAMQRWLGTVVDGIVSGQKKGCKKYLQACINGVWQFNNGKGSLMIKALQKKVGAASDGYAGPDTVKALQRFLNVEADGYLGAVTAKALQNYLNGLKK